MKKSADAPPGGEPPEGKKGLRRRKRASSIAGELQDKTPPPVLGDGDPPVDPSGLLSRAERRRMKHAPSDRAAADRDRELSDRQRKMLGLAEDDVDIPDTRPPPEPRRAPAWQRHDLAVLAIGTLTLALGTTLHAVAVAPELERFTRHGLSLMRPSGWLPPVAVPPPPLRLAADAPLEDGAPGGDPPYHVVFASPVDPLASIEVRLAPRGDHEGSRLALTLARTAAHGETVWAEESDSHTIAGHDWQRTRYRYATRIGRSSEPVLATGIEYAATHGDLDVVVTFHGSESAARRLEALIAPTLNVAIGRGQP